MPIWLAVVTILVMGFLMSIKTVPQQQAWIVHRFQKFSRRMDAGFNLIIPFCETIAYKHSLKETAIEVPEQAGITRDNVTLMLDGILYVRITDPVAASYGVSNPINAVQLLAQTTMRSEIG